ncbi:MAG: glycosyl hydrolase [Acidobacteria bacterium]|nr:glycosyl hydrolase [Acidobacteriota bacterium]
MKTFQILILICLLTVMSNAQWVKQEIETTASFRGLSVVSEKVVWASGTGGTVIRTVDGGDKWDVIKVPDAEKLDFRDIEAFDANTAYIISIGNGDASRIYKTVDGGKTWSLQFRNTDEKAFYDAIACWDRDNCIAMSDPVDGRYVIIRTADGKNWEQMNSENMPDAQSNEASFAASGTCLIIHGKKKAFLVTGGGNARVFRSNDRGMTWASTNTPIIRGTPGSGIFSIAMGSSKTGVIVGGNYEKPDETGNNIAITRDGGKTWLAESGLGGYRSAVVYVNEKMLIAVGTNGSDVSTDAGDTWKPLGKENLNAVAAKGRKAVWAVGPRGAVFRLGDQKIR